MKKVSRILLLISTILSWVDFGVMALCTIIMFICATPLISAPIKEGIENGSITMQGEITPDMAAHWVTLFFILLGIAFLICAVFFLLCAIFSQKARSKETTSGYVTAIVFVALISQYVAIVGSIFGLIALKQNGESEVIDVAEKK